MANEDCMHCFFYDDSIAGSGPNEVISLLNCLLEKLREKYGRFDQLVAYTDNSPSQFKQCFLFFYFHYLVQIGQFLRIDLKFLLEGHSYSICDRRFGCIQQFFNTQEKIEIPQQWATILKSSHLRNIEVHWVTLDMVMDYKSFLRKQYVSRSEDAEGCKFEVKKIAWINYGYGEITDNEGNLHLVQHDKAYVRFKLDTKEKPRIVSFCKMRQAVKLTPDLLLQLRHEQKPVNTEVKQNCEKLAHKYLSETAERFYASLSCVDEDDE